MFVMFCIVFIMVNYKPSFWRRIKAFKILGSAPQHCLFCFFRSYFIKLVFFSFQSFIKFTIKN